MKRRIFIIVVFLMLITKNLVGAKEEKGVQILNVGKGQCIILNYGSGKGMIGYGLKEYSEFICKCINKESIGQLDFLILPQGNKVDIDYINKITKEFNIKSIYLIKNKNINRDDFRDMNNNFEIIENGWRYKDKDIDLELLPPINQKKEGLDSVLLYGKVDGLTYLFSGDLNKEDQNLMLQYDLIPEANILNIKNHDGKTTTKFLNKVKPKVAVFSDDKLKTSRYPNGDNLRIAGCKIYSTYDNGDIVIRKGEGEGGIEVKALAKETK